jgi:DNA-binding SARP family transcriptional activator
MASGVTRLATRPSSTRAERSNLNLIRGFRLRDGQTSIALPRNAQRVLAFLALHETALPRDHVAQCLWMDMPDERAAANLRTALWRINRLGFPLVNSERGDIELAAGVEVDVRVVMRKAAGLVGSTSPLGLPENVTVHDFDADLLPGWYEDWVLLEQERFRQLRLHALEALCVRLTVERQFGEAVQAGLAAVACEPLRETAQSALISAYVAEGNLIEAVRQYRAYAGLLEEGLGIEPGPQVEALLRPARAGVRSAPARDATFDRRPGDAPTNVRETLVGDDRRRMAEPIGVAHR